MKLTKIRAFKEQDKTFKITTSTFFSYTTNVGYKKDYLIKIKRTK